MTDTLIIHGYSDDLIEVDGVITDEFEHYGSPAVITITVDDTVYATLRVEYSPDGADEWRIQPTTSGALVSVTRARGEDAGQDEDGCAGYSDKAVVDMAGIEASRISVSLAEVSR